MSKCKSCSGGGVNGIEDAKYTAVAAAVVGAVITGRIDQAITTNADGTKKVNFLADNPMAKNAAFIAAGLAITAFMPGEMYAGLGIGWAAYGGYNLVEELMKKDDVVAGVYGLKMRPPTNIAGVHGQQNGLRTLPGNYGISPSLIAGVNCNNYQGSNYAQQQAMNVAQKMAVPEKVKSRMPLGDLTIGL